MALENADLITLGDQQLEFLTEVSDSVTLTEMPAGLDLEGTVVVPTAQLLAVALDNMGGERLSAAKPSKRDDSSRIKKYNQILTTLNITLIQTPVPETVRRSPSRNL